MAFTPSTLPPPSLILGFAQVTFSVFLTASTCLGRLEPIRRPDGDDDETTASVVGDVISSLDQSSSVLNKGVLVTAADWTSDVPRGFLRALQTRHGQPVYAVGVARLLADGRRYNDTDDDGPPQQQQPQQQQQQQAERDDDDDRHNHFDQTADWLPAACKPPAGPGGPAALASALPLRAGYAVLFPGPGPPADGPRVDWPLAQLAALDRGFWNADVYYVLVVREFGLAVRQTVHGLWRDRSVYK